MVLYTGQLDSDPAINTNIKTNLMPDNAPDNEKEIIASRGPVMKRWKLWVVFWISAGPRDISSLLTIVYWLFTMSITRPLVASKRGASDSKAISRHLSKLSASFNGRKMQIYSGAGYETHRVLIMMATYMDRQSSTVGDYSWPVFNQPYTGVS